jgi:hypothetical protein
MGAGNVHRSAAAVIFAAAMLAGRCGKETASLDGDGVEMLFPSAPGSSFRLGSSDPNATEHFAIEQGTRAVAGTDGAIRFWNIPSYALNYAGGGSGWTSRLHIYASGGATQQFNWKTQSGYLYSSADVRNQEFTVYARVHQFLDPSRAALTLKIRGGAHTASNGDLASCVMLSFHGVGEGHLTRFGKELFHPDYDYLKLTPAFDAALADGAWTGMKMVSWSVAGRHDQVVNRLYLDTDPFDRATGKPKNGWRLFSEYIDVEGQSTGRYSKLADWGGWETTFRTDGIHDLDFAIVSLREIAPPR